VKSFAVCQILFRTRSVAQASSLHKKIFLKGIAGLIPVMPFLLARTPSDFRWTTTHVMPALLQARTGSIFFVASTVLPNNMSCWKHLF